MARFCTTTMSLERRVSQFWGKRFQNDRAHVDYNAEVGRYSVESRLVPNLDRFWRCKRQWTEPSDWKLLQARTGDEDEQPAEVTCAAGYSWCEEQ